MKTKKFFNFLRIIAVAALVCTVAVIAVMLIYSATPGEKSAQQSNQVANEIKDVFDVEDEKVESKKVAIKSEKLGFIGESYKLDVKFTPEDTTDKSVTFNSSDPSVVSVSRDGTVTMHSTGTASVTVALKSDPSIKSSATMTCLGTHPSKIQSVSLEKDSFLVGNSEFNITDQNGVKLSLKMFTPTVKDESLLSFTNAKIDAFIEGSTDVFFKLNTNLGKKDYEAKTFGPYKVTVLHNPDFVAPQKIVTKSDSYDLPVGHELYMPDLIEKLEPSGAKISSLRYEPSKELTKLTGDRVTADAVSDGTIKIYTKYAEDCVATVNVHVYVPRPSSLTIVNGPKNRRAQYDKSYTLKVVGDETYVEDITWSIVKGSGTIDPKTGKLSGLKLGKNVTVRATYNDPNDPNAPDLHADYTLKVVMYENFAASMRKLVGHFLLFMVIGFGLAYTYVFMIKPRALALPLAIVSGFGLSVASEALQLPSVTAGRYATWSDVFIDFFGSVIGVVFAFVLLGIILLAIGLSKSRREFKQAFKAVSITTVFRPTSSAKLQKLLSAPSEEDVKGDLSDRACANVERDNAPSQDNTAADETPQDVDNKT